MNGRGGGDGWMEAGLDWTGVKRKLENIIRKKTRSL